MYIEIGDKVKLNINLYKLHLLLISMDINTSTDSVIITEKQKNMFIDQLLPKGSILKASETDGTFKNTFWREKSKDLSIHLEYKWIDKKFGIKKINTIKLISGRLRSKKYKINQNQSN